MILDDILRETRAELDRRKAVRPMETVAAAALKTPAPRGLANALRGNPVGCIAEFKRRSPSAGWIREGADPVDIAHRYQAAGASAISVLTDGPFFGGGLDDLRAVRGAVDLPLLRKDFVVDRYQLAEAREAGADAVLLIVAALTDAELRDLLAGAGAFGLDVLVEAHSEDEVRRALALPAPLIGINHRDLKTFQVDTTLALRMRPSIPPDRLVVAESGIRTHDDVRQLAAGGIDAILVGESLMRAQDPGRALGHLLGRQ